MADTGTITEVADAHPGRSRGGAGHESAGWPTRVYKWDVSNVGGKKAYQPGQQVIDQLRLAHELSCRMVEISRARDEAVDAAYLAFPEAAAAREAVDAAEAAIEEALEEVRQVRVREKTRDVTGPEVDHLKEAQAAARQARLGQRTVRKTLTAQVRPTIREADAAYKVAAKAAYQEFAGRGLYWATINETQDAAKRADQRIITLRSEGRPAQRRMPRWDGSGMLAVSLQRQADKPQRTPARLTGPDENCWWNVVRLPDRTGRVTVGLGMGRGLPMVQVPVVAHRLPPVDADVVGVRLVARRVASRVEWSVSVVAKVPPATPRTGGPTMAVHVGWRTEPDGRARAAVWRADRPVEVPGKLADIVTQDGPSWGRLLVPRPVLTRMDVADDVQSVRDLEYGSAREKVAAWLDEHPQPGPGDGVEPVAAADVRRWRSPSRLAVLALRWRDTPPEGDGGAEVAAVVEEWRRWDKLRWEAQVCGDRRGRLARREIGRRFAAWTAETASTVVVDDTNLAKVQAAPKLRQALPAVAEDAAAGRRHAMAAGETRQAVVAAVTREGGTVVEASHKGMTVTHHVCGHVNPADERWVASAVVRCDGCGASFDQDHNAADGMLRAVQRPEAHT